LIAFLKVLETIVEDKIGYLNPAILAHVITNRCNLRCEYCVFWRRKFGKELQTDEIFSIIDQAEELGISFYSVTGGEPLLRDDIPEILRYAHDKGMVTTLVTNGILLRAFDSQVRYRNVLENTQKHRDGSRVQKEIQRPQSKYQHSNFSDQSARLGFHGQIS